MTGTLNTTTTHGNGQRIQKVTLAWTADASGAVEQPTANTEGNPIVVNGTLHRVAFAPGDGDEQPSDQYDVTLLDENGIDVLAGQGANLGNASASDATPAGEITDGSTSGLYPRVLNDVLTLNVSGAGNGNSGQVVLYLR